MIEAIAFPLLGLLALSLAVDATARLCELVLPGLTPTDGDPWLRRSVVGLWIWALLLFGLAFSGLYTPGILTGLIVVLALFGTVLLLRGLVAARGVNDTLSSSAGHGSGRHGSEPRGPGWPWMAAIGAFFVTVFAIAANPTVSWDAAVYHLALPGLYLEAGGFRPAPFLVYAHWPHAVDLVYGAAMALADHRLAKAVHLLFGLATVVFLARSTRGGAWARGLAGALFLLSGVVVFEIRVAYVDLALAFFALALFLLLDESPEGEDRRRLVVAGAAAGLLAASKVSGPVIAAAVSLPFVVGWLRRPGGARKLFFFALPALLSGLPWVLRSFLDTGNPVYPALYGLFGGPDWSPDLAARFGDWQRSIGRGRETADWLLLPWRVLTEGGEGYGRFDGRLSVAWLLFLPLALWDSLRRHGSTRGRRALVACGLYFVFWAATSQQMRFLIPLLPLLSLAAAEGAARAIRRLRRRSASRWLRPRRLAIVSALVWSAWMTWDHGRVLASGVAHLRLYAQSGFEMPATPPRPPVFEAMETLPPDAAVLLLGSNHLFHCPRECVVDSFFEASQISDWLSSSRTPEEVSRRLRQRGLTHVAWHNPPAGAAYPRALLQLLRRPDLATVVARPAERSGLWRLQDDAEGTSPAGGSEK